MTMQYEFAGEITPDQIKQHLVRTFEVPAGASRIDLDFQYTPHQVAGRSNLLTLTIFDPGGFRGEGHKMEPVQHVTLSRVEATPGYMSGEILEGSWSVIINTHMVLEAVRYRLVANIAFEDDRRDLPQRKPGHTAPRGPGWYRGDLHAHTVHSDGDWTVADLLAYAREERLDFVTLSDHNTLSPLDEILSASADDLLTLGGMELTTFYGHALALGIRSWVDWRVRPGERSMSDILAVVENADGWFIIAHPMALGDPVCTGCDWQYADVMPGKARAVEIWNGEWDDPSCRNEEALNLWYGWLNQGYRMVATAGSDIHGRPSRPTVYGRNVIYARELSERAIWDAARRGRLYISAGPTLTLRSEESGMMGDILTDPKIQATAHWENIRPNSELRWVVNGQVQQRQPCTGSGGASLTVTQGWCTVELRDDQNRLQAITNPLFVGSGWR